MSDFFLITKSQAWELLECLFKVNISISLLYKERYTDMLIS